MAGPVNTQTTSGNPLQTALGMTFGFAGMPPKTNTSTTSGEMAATPFAAPSVRGSPKGVWSNRRPSLSGLPALGSSFFHSALGLATRAASLAPASFVLTSSAFAEDLSRTPFGDLSGLANPNNLADSSSALGFAIPILGGLALSLAGFAWLYTVNQAKSNAAKAVRQETAAKLESQEREKAALEEKVEKLASKLSSLETALQGLQNNSPITMPQPNFCVILPENPGELSAAAANLFSLDLSQALSLKHWDDEQFPLFDSKVDNSGLRKVNNSGLPVVVVDVELDTDEQPAPPKTYEQLLQSLKDSVSSAALQAATTSSISSDDPVKSHKMTLDRLSAALEDIQTALSQFKTEAQSIQTKDNATVISPESVKQELMATLKTSFEPKLIEVLEQIKTMAEGQKKELEAFTKILAGETPSTRTRAELLSQTTDIKSQLTELGLALARFDALLDGIAALVHGDDTQNEGSKASIVKATLDELLQTATAVENGLNGEDSKNGQQAFEDQVEALANTIATVKNSLEEKNITTMSLADIENQIPQVSLALAALKELRQNSAMRLEATENKLNDLDEELQEILLRLKNQGTSVVNDLKKELFPEKEELEELEAYSPNSSAARNLATELNTKLSEFEAILSNQESTWTVLGLNDVITETRKEIENQKQLIDKAQKKSPR